MAELRTRYLGLALRSPLVASSSPLTGNLDSLRRLEDAGVAAVVLPSLFEEEITEESLAVHGALEAGAGSFAEALDYHPELGSYETGPDRYLELVAAAKRALGGPVPQRHPDARYHQPGLAGVGLRAPVLREQDPHVVPERDQRARQCPRHVGEPAGLGEGRHLGSDHQDAEAAGHLRPPPRGSGTRAR